MKKSKPTSKPAPKVKSQSTQKAKSFDIPDWGMYLVFLAFTVIYFFPQISGSSYFWEDFTEYVYPTQTFAARETVEEGIPFWNPYTFAGMPFLADLQVGYFYLPNRLMSLFIDSDGMLSVWWLQLLIILHFLVAQIAMYRLARYLSMSKGAAAVSAVSWAFSMILTSHVFHPMMIYHLAWFPLIFMYFKKGLDKDSPSNGLIGGGILGLTLLAGHPQTTLYEFLFLGFYFLAHFFGTISNKNKDTNYSRYLIAGIVPFIIAAGIFMIQLLPSNELADLSDRAEMSYEESAEGSLEYKQILTAFVPKLFGYMNGNNDPDIPYHLETSEGPAPYFYFWETSFYFGVAALSLAIVGFLRRKDKVLKRFLIFILLFGLFYALGSNFILHELFSNFPLFGQFRNPARMMFFLVFAFSIFAGFGLDMLQKSNAEHKRKFLIIASIPALILVMALLGALQGIVGSPSEHSSAIGQTVFLPLISVAATILVMLQLLKGKMSTNIAGLGLALLILIDLTNAGGALNKSDANPKEAYTLNGDLEKMLKPNDSELFRVNSRLYEPVPFMAMKRNQGMVSEIPLVEGYNPLVLQQVFPPVSETEAAFDLMNIKYYIEFNRAQNRPYFGENIDLLPRIWTVHSNAYLNELDVEPQMKKGKFDFENEVVTIDPVPYKLSHEFDVKTSEEIIEYKNNYIKAEVNTPQNGIVVFSEVYYPAWKAYVNDKEAELFQVNGNMRGVPVESGESIIELKYESAKFFQGMIVSIVTLLAAIGGILYFRKKEQD